MSIFAASVKIMRDNRMFREQVVKNMVAWLESQADAAERMPHEKIALVQLPSETTREVAAMLRALLVLLAVLVLGSSAHAYSLDPNVAATEPCLTLKDANAIVAQHLGACHEDEKANYWFHICMGEKSGTFFAKDGKTVVSGVICAPYFRVKRYGDAICAVLGFLLGLLARWAIQTVRRVRLVPALDMREVR